MGSASFDRRELYLDFNCMSWASLVVNRLSQRKRFERDVLPLRSIELSSLGRKPFQVQLMDLLVLSFGLQGYPYLLHDESTLLMIERMLNVLNHDIFFGAIFVEPAITGGFIVGMRVGFLLISMNDVMTLVSYLEDGQVCTAFQVFEDMPLSSLGSGIVLRSLSPILDVIGLGFGDVILFSWSFHMCDKMGPVADRSSNFSKFARSLLMGIRMNINMIVCHDVILTHTVSECLKLKESKVVRAMGNSVVTQPKIEGGNLMTQKKDAGGVFQRRLNCRFANLLQGPRIMVMLLEYHVSNSFKKVVFVMFGNNFFQVLFYVGLLGRFKTLDMLYSIVSKTLCGHYGRLSHVVRFYSMQGTRMEVWKGSVTNDVHDVHLYMDVLKQKWSNLEFQAGSRYKVCFMGSCGVNRKEWDQEGSRKMNDREREALCIKATVKLLRCEICVHDGIVSWDDNSHDVRVVVCKMGTKTCYNVMVSWSGFVNDVGRIANACGYEGSEIWSENGVGLTGLVLCFVQMDCGYLYSHDEGDMAGILGGTSYLLLKLNEVYIVYGLLDLFEGIATGLHYVALVWMVARRWGLKDLMLSRH